MSSCPIDCCWINDRVYPDHDVINNKDADNDVLVGNKDIRPKSFLDHLLDSIESIPVSKDINDVDHDHDHDHDDDMKIDNLDSMSTETTTTSLDSSTLSTFSNVDNIVKTIDKTKTPPTLTKFMNNSEYNIICKQSGNNTSLIKCDNPSYSVTKTTSTSPREISIDLSHIGIPISIEIARLKQQQNDVQQLQLICASPVGGYFDGRNSMQYNIQLPISSSQDQQPRLDISADETNLEAPPQLNRCLPKNGFLFLDEKEHSINKPNTNPDTGLWCGGSLIDDLNEDEDQIITDNFIHNDDFVDEKQNKVSSIYDYCLAFDNLKIGRIFDIVTDGEDSDDYDDEEEDDDYDDDEGDNSLIGDDCLFPFDEKVDEDEEADDDDDEEEGDNSLIGDDCLFTSDEEIDENEKEVDDDVDEEEGVNSLVGDVCLFTSDEEIDENEKEVDDGVDEEEGVNSLVGDVCLFTSDEEV